PAAETFATIESILEGSFDSYPEEQLFEAWKKAIFPDHGMGGAGNWKDTATEEDEVVDKTFARDVAAALMTAEETLKNSFESIADKINFKMTANNPIPIVVYNTLSWERTSLVTCTVEPAGETWGIVDWESNPVTFQVLSENEGKKKIVFIAEDVPSLGYKTYYLVHTNISAPENSLPSIPTSTDYKNQYYEVLLTNGGVKSLIDRDTGVEILKEKTYNTDIGNITFHGFELYTMHSGGDDWLLYDAGEFSEIPQPVLDASFTQVSSSNPPAWDIVTTGNICDVYRFEKILDGNGTSKWHCKIVEELIFYRSLKRIDCKIYLLDWGKNSEGEDLSVEDVQFREWRMVLPVNFSEGRVTYEVPMGTVLVGRDEIQTNLEAWYKKEPRQFHPREIQNFLSVTNSAASHGVTMGSCVSVCDYVFPPGDNSPGPDEQNLIPNPLIQPILLATRKTNGGDQKVYAQRGDHEFLFTLFSHEGDWSSNSIQGGKAAIQANNPLIVVIAPELASNPFLDEEKGFCSVSPSNIIISALKKRDNDLATPLGKTDENVIVRAYDIEGKEEQYDTTLDFFCKAEGVSKTNIIEEYVQGGASGEGDPVVSQSGQSVNFTVGHHAIETMALVSPDAIAPSVPTNLCLEILSKSNISLTWDKSTDNKEVAGYEIYRDGLKIGAAAENSYKDNAFNLNKTYDYQVFAYDHAGNHSDLSLSEEADTSVRNYAASSIGGKVVSFTSQKNSGKWMASNLINGQKKEKDGGGWSSKRNYSLKPQKIIFELSDFTDLTKIIFYMNYVGKSIFRPKKIKVYTSEYSNKNFTKLGTFYLNKNTGKQSFDLSKIGTPARYVRLKLYPRKIQFKKLGLKLAIPSGYIRLSEVRIKGIKVEK
ncbi:MAG: discoidin domain-containing protein, partial [Candidatus Theseobacter exili]|nr:discoidin domain-containing protein [Candidatus Theseobacter exili]